MPCRYDELEPSPRRAAEELAANLLVYVLDKLGEPLPAWAEQAADQSVGLSGSIPALCAKIKSLAPEQKEQIVYNAKDRTSRALADWWEDHEKQDKLREEREAAERKRNSLRQQARAKLTAEEIRALGLAP